MIFLEPLALLLLALPLALFLFSIKNLEQKISTLFSESVLKTISVYPKLKINNATNYRLFLLSIVFFILAIAKPVSNEKITSDKESITPLVIALDISKSMLSRDIYPSRLEFAKKKILKLVSTTKNLRAGLILFNFNSYLASPLSEDMQSLAFILKNVDLNQKFESGSNLFSVIEGANTLLKNYKIKNILFISDGGNSEDYKSELEYSQENNITINAIHISKNSSSKSAFKNLVLNSGGAYEEFSYSNDDINSIMSKIEKISQELAIKRADEQSKKYIQFFYYPLTLALMLLLFVFSYPFNINNKVSLLILISLLFRLQESSILNADILDFKHIKDAKELYKKGEYIKASEIYRELQQNKVVKYNLANSLYKAKKYKDAISLYKSSISKNKTLNAKIYHNIANSYFRLKSLKLAKINYEKAIEISDNNESKENLKNLIILMKKLKKMKKKRLEDKYKLPKNMSAHKKEPEESVSSDYTVKLKNMVLSEEEKWMKLLKSKKTTIFLQKLQTTKVSQNAKQDF